MSTFPLKPKFHPVCACAPTPGFARHQQGLSLIELMIAMTLGLFLLLAVVGTYVGSKQSYALANANARVQEAGRFAMEFLAQDIRMADYWGCLQNGGVITDHLNPGLGFNFAGGGIQGVDGVTDSITLRGASSSGIQVVPPFMPGTAAVLMVANNHNQLNPLNPLNQRDIVAVSDCVSTDIFQVTSMNPGQNGTVGHNGGNNPGIVPGNTSGQLNRTYTGNANLYQLQQITYSVQPGSNNEQALFRQAGAGAAQELVPGVEDMQILYGADTDATPDGVANFYVSANTAGLVMAQVVSVRINLLVRSASDNVTTAPTPYRFNNVVTTPADRRLRHAYTFTVAVRNRLP